MTLPEVYKRLRRYDRGEIGFEAFTLIGLSNAYLFCSYAYYERNENLIGDQKFDAICKHLYDNWDFLEAEGVRALGDLIQEGNLKAGTFLGVAWPRVLKEIGDELVELLRDERADHLPMRATEEYDI